MRKGAVVDEPKTPEAQEVVVGTDGTETALRAVAWAAAEARLRGVPLRIVHAAPYAMPSDKAGGRRAAAILANSSTSSRCTHSWRLPTMPVCW